MFPASILKYLNIKFIAIPVWRRILFRKRNKKYSSHFLTDERYVSTRMKSFKSIHLMPGFFYDTNRK